MTNPLIIDAPEGQPFLDYTREFEAPLEALYAAYTTREYFERWFGPDGLTLSVDEFDVRTGGGFRYAVSGGGERYAFRGRYHTVRPNALLIQTFEFETEPDAVSLEFIGFEGLGARSRLAVHSVSTSVHVRDAIDLRGGVESDFARLDKVLAETP